MKNWSDYSFYFVCFIFWWAFFIGGGAFNWELCKFFLIEPIPIYTLPKVKLSLFINIKVAMSAFVIIDTALGSCYLSPTQTLYSERIFNQAQVKKNIQHTKWLAA